MTSLAVILYLDFVHLSEATNGVNQALRECRENLNHLVFLVDH